MTADHARGGAWHVRENALEGLAVPPCVGGAGVAGDDLHAGRGELEALQVLAHAREAGFVTVERDELDVGELEQMCGLAARARRRRRARAARQRRSSGAASCAPGSWTANATAIESGNARRVHCRLTTIPASPAGVAADPAAANSDSSASRS
jgi:hypothetical protein